MYDYKWRWAGFYLFHSYNKRCAYAYLYDNFRAKQHYQDFFHGCWAMGGEL